MFVTNYDIKRWHRINGKFVYLIKLNSELWATVINDTDNATTLESCVHLRWINALHTYNEWKERLYEENSRQ